LIDAQVKQETRRKPIEDAEEIPPTMDASSSSKASFSRPMPRDKTSYANSRQPYYAVRIFCDDRYRRQSSYARLRGQNRAFLPLRDMP
jgi:hypothetical protein